MRKIYYVFMLAVMALVTSCDDYVGEEGKQASDIPHENFEYVYAYKPGNHIQTKASALREKVWQNGSTIKIKFLTANNDSQNYSLAQNKVKELAAQWLAHANLSFEFVPEGEYADVKIAFNWEGKRVAWSQIGKDCINTPQNEPSTNLVLLQNNSSEIKSKSFKAEVLLQIGHILGLVNEHQSSQSNIRLKEQETIWYLTKSGWTEQEARGVINTYYTQEQSNSTEFDVKSIMLWNFPSYLIEGGVGSAYNTELSDKDKQLMQALYPGNGGGIVLPDRIELTYKQNNDPNSYEYTAVRIGEYYWLNNNFYHAAPRQGWIYDVGGESDVTTEMFDTYMKAIHLDLRNKNTPYFPNQVYNLENFNRYYGRYYNRSSINYMSENGKMYEGGNVSSNWELPSYVDYRQLFAMCPHQYSDALSKDDIHTALAARHGDNPATSPYYYEVHNKLIPGENPELIYRCKDRTGGFGIHAVYWYHSDLEGSAVKNMYGFNLMAGGARGNGSWTWYNDLYDIETGNSFHNGTDQYIYHLFYTVGLYTKESNIYIHDHIETNRAYTHHWFNARWCRKLTDVELGYRLYINQSQTDIKKLSLTENAPAGYTELPNGYLRGFYVQYILDNPNPRYTIADIVRFSQRVIDTTL